jgi:hypothetical protein
MAAFEDAYAVFPGYPSHAKQLETLRICPSAFSRRKGRKTRQPCTTPKKLTRNDPLKVRTAGGGKGGGSRYRCVIHEQMSGSMGFSDLHRDTLKILLGTHIGDMMRYGNSAFRQFLGGIFQRGRINIDEGQMALPRRQRSSEAIRRTCDDGHPAFISSHHGSGIVCGHQFRRAAQGHAGTGQPKGLHQRNRNSTCRRGPGGLPLMSVDVPSNPLYLLQAGAAENSNWRDSNRA